MLHLGSNATEPAYRSIRRVSLRNEAEGPVPSFLIHDNRYAPRRASASGHPFEPRPRIPIRLIQPVNVGKPDARFGTFLLEQSGGATGELTAALP